jgi:hypothetical protein
LKFKNTRKSEKEFVFKIVGKSHGFIEIDEGNKNVIGVSKPDMFTKTY